MAALPLQDFSANKYPLWKPSKERCERTTLYRFMQQVSKKYGAYFRNYDDLHAWSIKEPEQFWHALWHFFPIAFSKPYTQVRTSSAQFWKTRWFEGARLNFAENLIASARNDEHTALHFVSERGEVYEMSYKHLYEEVSLVAQALARRGVRSGDRVAGYMPNIPETVIAMLAATSLGAVWSSCSAEFGAMGIKDRLLQIAPKVIFASDGYTYKGKQIPILDNLIPLIDAMADEDAYARLQVVVVPYLQGYSRHNSQNSSHNNHQDGPPNQRPTQQPVNASYTSYSEFVADSIPSKAIDFVQQEANDPLYILFSSGTTGPPKAIVHGIVGTLLQHLKELALHSNLRVRDTIFFYTTCGWMMWNWVVSALFFKAKIVLYEGNPFYPCENHLIDIVKKARVKIFGAGARYFQELQKNKVPIPAPLDSLKVVLSTGSPLSSDSYRYIYSDIKSDVQLSSISGGTDIISCFVLGCPLLPVYEGEIQCKGLGMAVEIYDAEGKPTQQDKKSTQQDKGELVCTAPFVSMPLYFWNDKDDVLYKSAYFSNASVWTHGDYAELSAQGGIIMHGRSDATLNPGGVRIGTAELYRSLEGIDYISDAVAVGYTVDHDSRILLFIVVKKDFHTAVDIAAQSNWKELKNHIRSQTSPRHVPSRVYLVPDIPRTMSGKTSESCVSDLIHKREPKNVSALANPESLDFFRTLIV